MQKINLDDTIAAISTPLGESGIGIVRLSGRKSLSIADKIFVSKDRRKPSHFKTYTTHYGWIVNRPQTTDHRPQKKNKKLWTIGHGLSTKIIDEVILTVMRTPKSYTKEDIVEINCHSGIVPLKRILDLVITCGARLARPGEFTQRAFINGRIDLAQAEAVLDIIKAKTEASLKVGINQLKGGLSCKINELKENLLDILASLEAQIDFSEEDIPATNKAELLHRLSKITKQIDKLLEESSYGKVLREGIICVICGKPNVGKSLLLNALLRQERAIVTPIAGTTRDTIEEVVNINGIPLKIVDTAGIIETENFIEKEAIRRTKNYLNLAQLILFVFDGSQTLSKEDNLLIKELKDRHTIAIVNKIDLPQKINQGIIKRVFNKIVRISALKGTGLARLEDAILKMVWSGRFSPCEDIIVSNLRHADALRQTNDSLSRAIDSITQELSLEFISEDIKRAIDSLGIITGENINEDILERIFSEFCIGK